MGRCIWDVAPEKRRCVYCSFGGGCPKRAAAKEPYLPAEEYVEAMNEIVGVDIRRKTRKRPWPQWRFLVAYQMAHDGFSHSKIGEALGIDRCTVLYGVSAIANVMDLPQVYPYEMSIWEEYQKSINLLKNENVKEGSEVVAV